MHTRTVVVLFSLGVFAPLVACGSKSSLRVPRPPREPSIDAAVDAFSRDAPIDTGVDARVDTGTDAPSDTGTDAPIDAGRDAFLPPDRDAAAFLFGCADGEREGFLDPVRHQRIAGCGGGFRRAGLLFEDPPACERRAGDDGALPNGEGCGATDLCAEGWHICRSADEVALASPGGCDGVAGTEPAFFATRQSGPGCGVCARGGRTDCTGADCALDCAQTTLTANDLFGCGTLGDPPNANCAPLDRFSNNLCSATTPPWRCPGSSGLDEALLIEKTGPQGGGVLCCRDDVGAP